MVLWLLLSPACASTKECMHLKNLLSWKCFFSKPVVKKNLWLAERKEIGLLWKYIKWNNKTKKNVAWKKKSLAVLTYCLIYLKVRNNFLDLLCSVDVREITIRSQSLASLKALLSVISNSKSPASLFRRPHSIVSMFWGFLRLSSMKMKSAVFCNPSYLLEH